MTRRRLAPGLPLALAAALAGCGKVGPPVRAARPKPPAEAPAPAGGAMLPGNAADADEGTEEHSK
jgi:hypothetical protein